MEREQLKGKQTPGIVHVDFRGCDIYNESQTYIATCSSSRVGHKANAALYAEAHNVANETAASGACMWPLDMVARIRELEASLKECTEWMEQLRASGDAGFWEWEKESKYTKAQELLNKNP